MKLGKRILKYVLIPLASIFLGVFIFFKIVSPGTTSAFKDAEGKVVQNSIAEMAYVAVGDNQQFVLMKK